MQLVALTSEPAPAPFAPSLLSLEDFEGTKKIVSWTADREGNWFVAKARPHLVGRILARNTLFSAPPSIDPSLFVDLILYSSGLKPPLRTQRAGAVVNPLHEHDAFLRMIAEVMSMEAEKLLRGGTTKIYEERSSRTHALRGRINWSSSFSRPRQEGLVCDYFLLEMDNELNQLVLAGVEAAARLAPTPQLSSVLFAWRSVCGRRAVSAAQFDRAIRILTRRTEMYRPALTLAKILLFGASVEDAFSIGSVDLPEMYFDLAILFEKATARLLSEYFNESHAEVLAQDRDDQAICYADRSTYQIVKPDIRVMLGQQVLAIFDAKFKSRYLHGERASEADLYQAFLYASRATSLRFPLVCAGILVPRIEAAPITPISQRHIVIPRGHDDIHLRVLPVEIEAAMHAIRQGRSAKAAVSESPELHDVCLAIEAAVIGGTM